MVIAMQYSAKYDTGDFKGAWEGDAHVMCK